MTRQRYSPTESLNRILRLFQGKAVPQDTPGTVTGDVLSPNEAISDLAELLGGSLPNESLVLPSGFVATVDEANANSSLTDEHALTPASHAWAHEYGGIYVSTGTVDQILAATTWAKLTGTFQNYMPDSGAEIDCDWNDDRILVNEVGTYLIQYQASLINLGDAVTLDLKSYMNLTAQPSTRSSAAFGASGTADAAMSMSGFGYVEIVTGGYAVDLRAYPSAATTVKVACAQLLVQKMVG